MGCAAIRAASPLSVRPPSFTGAVTSVRPILLAAVNSSRKPPLPAASFFICSATSDGDEQKPLTAGGRMGRGCIADREGDGGVDVGVL